MEGNISSRRVIYFSTVIYILSSFLTPLDISFRFLVYSSITVCPLINSLVLLPIRSFFRNEEKFLSRFFFSIFLESPCRYSFLRPFSRPCPSFPRPIFRPSGHPYEHQDFFKALLLLHIFQALLSPLLVCPSVRVCLSIRPFFRPFLHP